jgi:hypothetical protein
MSASGSKTEVGQRKRDFRSTPESGHQADIAVGPKSAQEETHAPQQFVSLFARLFILSAAFGFDALRFHLGNI